MKEKFKSNSVTILVILCLIAVVFCIVFAAKSTDKTFEIDDFTVRMSATLKEIKSEKTNYIFENSRVGAAFSISRLSSLGFDKYATADDLLEYAQTINPDESFYSATRQTGTTYSFIERELTEGDKLHYQMFGAVTGNSKVLYFTFSCSSNDKQKYQSEFKKWASTINLK